MSFKIDDKESASQTIAYLMGIARPTSGGPAADAAVDWALLNDPRTLPKVMQWTAEEAYKHVIEWRRIYCLTSRVKSTLMWSHYADKHRGICLEFAVRADNVFRLASKVIYEEQLIKTEIFDSTTALLPLILKAKCWSHEDEYRLILRIHDPDAAFPMPAEMHVINNKFKVPEDTLTAIVLGCCTPPEIEIRVQELVAEHWPSVKIKKMFKEPDRYELELRDYE